MKLSRYLLLTLLLLPSVDGRAQEEKWTHYGLRPLGMGNAFVAVADDFNALFYNPAGLARLKSWDGELLNPYAEMSATTADFIGDAQDLASGSSGDTEAILNVLEKETGTVHHVAFGLTPHLIFPGFGFGLGIDLSTTMVFHRYPSIELDVGPTITVPIGIGFNMLEKRLALGVAVKGILRGGIDHEFSIQDIEALSSKSSSDTDSSDQVKIEDYIEGGVGVGADVGLLFTPIKTMEPTLGISIANIGGIPYTKMNVGNKALNAPELEEAAVNTGFSIKPLQSRGFYILTAIDVHAINQDYSFTKKLNLGMEFGLTSILKIQTGLHQGYLTGGMQFDVGILNLRLISYAEEVGPEAGTIEDRRYALQIKVII